MADQAQQKGAAKTSRVVDTWKLKRWYTIVSPQMFGSRPLGETVAAEDSSMIGRTIMVSLMNVTGDVKRQNANVIFEVDAVQNGVAQTKVKKMEINPASIRRMVRKAKDRIDMSFVCATNDNKAVRIKPFLISRGQAGGAALTVIRKLTEDVARVEVSKLSYEGFVNEVVTGRLQKMIRDRVNKVYPVKIVEIRMFEITTVEKPLPPVPTLEEIETESSEEMTEEEKIEKKVKAKAEKEVEEIKAEKKAKVKKAEEA